MNHWLVKSEPSSYSWQDFSADRRTAWTGVRNFAARRHLSQMKEGDPVLFYHSGTGKEVVGQARVTGAPYADPTADEGAWVCVDLEAGEPFRRAVALSELKTHPKLAGLTILKQPRLSVVSLSAEEFQTIVALGAGAAHASTR